MFPDPGDEPPQRHPTHRAISLNRRNASLSHHPRDRPRDKGKQHRETDESVFEATVMLSHIT